MASYDLGPESMSSLALLFLILLYLAASHANVVLAPQPTADLLGKESMAGPIQSIDH